MTLYVVDGDNLIGWSGGPRPDDDRRQEVVRRAQAVCEKTGATAVVVFDPTANAVDGSARVSVRVAQSRHTADEIIREMVDGARVAGDLTVVSSDKPLYSYARTRGARILRCHEWAALERGPSL